MHRYSIFDNKYACIWPFFDIKNCGIYGTDAYEKSSEPHFCAGKMLKTLILSGR
jgi:hypothetical protein